MLQALEEDDENSVKSSNASKSDDDDSMDSDRDNINDITRKDLFESIKLNARGGSELNKNKIFAELPTLRIRGSFQNSMNGELEVDDENQ